MTDHDIKTVNKILRHCNKLAATVLRTRNYDAFMNDDDAVDACIARIGQIGELSSRELSVEFKNCLKEIPWKAIYGMRNHLVHGYDKIDFPMLWETITEDVPILDKSLRNALNQVERDKTQLGKLNYIKPMNF